MFSKVKIGLALGAGGARGLSHLGVLKALERSNIRIFSLAGSSMGALVGAAYAAAGNTAELENRLMDFINSNEIKETGFSFISEVFNNKAGAWHHRLETWLKRVYLQARYVAASSVLDSETYRKMIDYFVPAMKIEDLPIPFVAVGTDLRTGKSVLFKSGPLRDAIYASCAIPGLVLPLSIKESLIVDGGVLNMVPVLPLRLMGVDVVMAVDVEKALEDKDDFGTAFDQLFRVEDIQSFYLKELHLKNADLVLSPKVSHIHWSEFLRASEAIRLGQDEVTEKLETIKALAKLRKMPWTRRKNPLPSPSWIEF